MGGMILVTGANGFVGRNLLQRIALRGDGNVVAVDLHEELAGQAARPKVTYRGGDLSDADFVNSLFDEFHFESIIHLAAVISQTADMATYFSIMNSNIRATFLLLEAARRCGARVLFPSTALVYGNQKVPFTEEMLPAPGDFYALSKHMCEELIRFYFSKYDVPYVIFRIGILYGPGQTGAMFIPSIVTALADGKDFPMTKGEQTRDFVYVGDFLDALEAALARRRLTGVFNIGSGAAPAMREVAEAAQRLSGRQGLVRIGALPYRPKEVWEYCLDIGKVRRELGWRPSVPLEDGLRRTIEHVRARSTQATSAI